MKIEFEVWKNKIISDWPSDNRASIERLFESLEKDRASYNGLLIINLYTTVRISDDKNAPTGLCDTTKPGVVEISFGLGGKDDFKALEYFLHEWCHFLQFLDYRCNRAQPFLKKGDDDLMFDYEDGIDKPGVSKKEIKDTYLRTMATERDCNQRLLSLLNMVGLEYDEDKMIKGMNAYHMSQLAFFDYRAFYKVDPAGVIAHLMPAKLMSVEELIKNYKKKSSKIVFSFNTDCT